METIKNIINTVVIVMKLLIWTLFVLHALAGLYLLLNGHPRKKDPQYAKDSQRGLGIFFNDIFHNHCLGSGNPFAVSPHPG